MIKSLRTAFVFSFFAVAASILCVSFAATSFGADSRPNIILFLADDMGPGDTSAYQDWTGNSDAEQIKTPVMEKLAASGVRFVDAHSPAAVCNPTRISLLRGGRPVDRPQDFGNSLPSMLKRTGYRTYGVGKWHVFFENGGDYHSETPIKLGPIDFGFDHYTGTQHNIAHSPAFIVDRSYHRYDEASGRLVPNRSKTPPGYNQPGGPFESICTQIWLDAARDYLDQHASDGKQADKPFFLYYPSHANHNHCYSPDTLDGIPVVGACKTADGQPLKSNRNNLKANRSEMVYENDVALSLLLNWLQETDDPRNSGQKMIANTLVIFTSDNGANVNPGDPGVGPMSGHKGLIEEGGHRVPFIVSWPARVPKGKTSETPVSLLDLYATFAAITGEALQESEGPDSCDLSAAFFDPTVNKRAFGPFVAQKLYPENCMIRAGSYKISWQTQNTKFHSLFDLAEDVGEERNLLGKPEFNEVEARLKSEARMFLERAKLPAKGRGQRKFDGRSSEGPGSKPATKKRRGGRPREEDTTKVDPKKEDNAQWSDAESRPNIVFILADDLGYGDLQCYNAKSKIPTPHLDRLAQTGMRFTDAHSGASVCSPTRYGLLTGRHFLRRPNWIEGILNQCLIDEEQLTLPEYLKTNGYHTACFGKWHLGQTWFNQKGQTSGPGPKTDYSRPTRGGPNDQGFDYFFGMNGTAVGAPLVLMENRLVTELPTVKGPRKGRPMAKSHRAVDVMPRTTEAALDYIDQSVQQRTGQPFFIYYAMTAIHTPIVPAPQYKGKSEASDYGDFVYQVDDAVGQIITRLEERGLVDDTLIVFSSDNGSHGRASEQSGNGPGSVIRKYKHKANANWRGLKGDGYEGGHRVPFIARWTEHIPTGTQCDELVTLEDFFATCAAILGKPLPKDSAEDSFNILPYLKGNKAVSVIRPYAVLSTFYGKPVIRKGSWVLLPFLESGGPHQKNPPVAVQGGPQGQLFDLSNDPKQTKNVWLDNPAIVKELTQLHAEHQSRGRSIGIER